MASYDILGNIVLVKFKRDTKKQDKQKWAKRFLRQHRAVTTVLEKTSRFKGRLRVQKTKHLFGDKTKEALYKENGCEFRLNVDSCYFSPRLAAERKEVAEMVKKGESVAVLFGGVAPFAIVIAKTKKARKIVSVELGRECNKYAKENVKRNKVNVDVISGDVRRVLPRLNEKFDRIVMARPNLKDSFLDAAFPSISKEGMIHYYGFCREDKLKGMEKMILEEARKAKRKIKIVLIKKAGDIGVRAYRWRIDLKIAK